MEDDIFSVVQRKIDKAGSKDPWDVADYFDIEVIGLPGSIIGYAVRYTDYFVAIGVNESLEGKWKTLPGPSRI